MHAPPRESKRKKKHGYGMKHQIPNKAKNGIGPINAGMKIS